MRTTATRERSIPEEHFAWRHASSHDPLVTTHLCQKRPYSKYMSTYKRAFFVAKMERSITIWLDYCRLANAVCIGGRWSGAKQRPAVQVTAPRYIQPTCQNTEEIGTYRLSVDLSDRTVSKTRNAYSLSRLTVDKNSLK